MRQGAVSPHVHDSVYSEYTSIFYFYSCYHFIILWEAQLEVHENWCIINQVK